MLTLVIPLKSLPVPPYSKVSYFYPAQTLL